MTIGDFLFRVVRADSRRLYMLQVEPVAPKVTEPGEAPTSPVEH